MKKIGILVFLLFALTTLASCNISGNDVGDTSDKGEVDSPYTDNENVFDIVEMVYVVTAKEADTPTCNIDELISLVIGENRVDFITDDKPIAGNEIIIGLCDREASVIGYEMLSDLPRDDGFVVRYGVYSSGDSIAIVYDNAPGLEEQIICCALRLFEELYIKENSSIFVGDDEFYSSTVEISDLQCQKNSESFKAFEESFGTETATALKQMYSELYTDKLVDWLASLYDSNYGGFYYSPSARDNLKVEYNGYDYYLLPDIESSALAIRFIENSGMMCGYESINDELSPHMCEQLVKFVKEKQSKDGYFYNPQWSGLEASISRKYYDLVYAEYLLSSLGASPTYNTPSGILGDGLLWSGESVPSIDAEVEFTDQLQDRESFLVFLDNLNVKEDSYFAGILLVNLIADIKARDEILKAEGADYSLADLLIDYLDDNCYSSTGCWEAEASFSAVNGLAEISLVYEAFGASLPYPLESARSAMAVINSTDTPPSSISLCNAWRAISNVVNNVESYYPKSGAAEIVTEIRRDLTSNGAFLIEKTATELKKFLNSDGSFSYSKNSSVTASKDMPNSLDGIKEGDIKSSIICTTELLEYIYGAFGSPVISAFTYDDHMRFMSIISDNEVTYNFAPSDSLKKTDAVNYKIYGYKNSDGEIVPMIKIYDSKKYEGEKLQRAILNHIITDKSGVAAGLSLERIDFYLAVIFENKFTYHKASSESYIENGMINYKITPYSNKATVLRIYNSYEITNEADMREILTYLIISEEGANANLSLSDIDYYVVEWLAHNIMYTKPWIIPFMSEEEVKLRAKHVDLNTDDNYAPLYSSIISIYG